jgi:hypothetical protein
MLSKHKRPLSTTLCAHQAPRGMYAASGIFAYRSGGLPRHVWEIGMAFQGHKNDMNHDMFPTRKAHKHMICGHCGKPGHMHYVSELTNTMGTGRDEAYLNKRNMVNMHQMRRTGATGRTGWTSPSARRRPIRTTSRAGQST